MVFPVVMYGCESWTIKKAEHWGIDAFELWCWRRLLKSSLDCKEIKPSIVEEIIPEYSLEGLMLKLKLQYFHYLMQRGDSLENTLILEKIEGRRRGQQRMRWLFTSGGQSIGASASVSVLPTNIQGWFPLGLTGLISLLSEGLSRAFSSTTIRRYNSSAPSVLYRPALTSIHDYWKNHSFD